MTAADGDMCLALKEEYKKKNIQRGSSDGICGSRTLCQQRGVKAADDMNFVQGFFGRREERGTLASQPIRACLLAIAKLLTPESSKAASASSAFNLPRIFLRFLPNAHRSLRSHREQPPIREESMTFYLPNIVKMLEDPCAAWRLLFL
ncbi:hypothetical protein DBR06_SOUSAS16910006, partial [Sousa chinensis]